MSQAVSAPAAALGVPAGYVQAPRWRVTANGKPLHGVYELEVVTNNFSEASRFKFSMAPLPGESRNLAWYAAQADIFVVIDAVLQKGGTADASGSPAPGWTTLLAGRVDSLAINPITGVAACEGRDLAGLFIDSVTQEAFQNQTASQIAAQFVAQQTAAYPIANITGAITPTTTPVGRFYGDNYNDVNGGQFWRATNQWNLLQYLAFSEGFQLYFAGSVLTFGPAPAVPYVMPVTFAGTPPVANVEHAEMIRSLTLAKDVEVTVMSWNSQGKLRTIGLAKSSHSQPSQRGVGPVQKYVFLKPDLDQNQALQFAQSRLRDITRRELIVNLRLPGELMLTPNDQVQISGTGTAFDQSYHVDAITRRFSFAQGFQESLRLKNHSTETQRAIY